MNSTQAIRISNLRYSYHTSRSKSRNQTCPESVHGGTTLCVDSLVIDAGERVIICGCNGAGKSTLLSIIGGRKHISGRTVMVLGRECFDDCSLSRDVCYLGDWWRTDFFLDVDVATFLGESICNSERCKELCFLLQIDLNWRISQLSDGQRRRCQILTALTSSETFKVYVLDEVTADLDIVSRERLLSWLNRQSSDFGATVLLATHIMDGLNEWATRILYLEDGRVNIDIPVEERMDIYSMIRSWMMRQAIRLP